MGWLAPVSHDLVWFTGPDAVGFLNVLISQEVGEMRPGEVRRSLLLGARGKLEHLLWVLRGDDFVGLIADEGRGDELAATLRRYRIGVEVEIEPDTRPLWVVMEEKSEGWSGDRDGELRADLSWRGVPRLLVAGERPDLAAGSEKVYEEARVRAGEPKWGVDVDEGTIPQETWLTGLAVDFDKGCYLGQELVSRIQHRGHVNRLMRHLLLSAPAPAGSTVTTDGKEVGSMTSVSGLVGLGMVRREVSPGDEVMIGEVSAAVAEIV